LSIVTATLASLCLTVRDGSAHPLHTTIAELTVRSDTRMAEVVVRVFADDLRRAVGGTGAPGDSAVAAYLGRHFVARDARGRSIAWAWCGQRRTDDLVWACLRAPVSDAMLGAELRVDVACALYDDQVNIVRLVSPRGRRTLLFTCGDRTQRLP
jgi:hypothetical protein